MRHIGIVELYEELLLEMLRLEGGRILAIERQVGCVGVIRIRIEHPDMPDVQDGMYLSPTHLSYTYTYDANGVVLKMERRV